MKDGDKKMEIGNVISFHVTLKYRPYGANVDVFDIYTGNSEAEALQKLNDYKAKSIEKYGRYVSPYELEQKAKAETSNEEGEDAAPKHTGKGAHFIGTTWVINRQTGEKLRIKKEEIGTYIAKGFVKGGPRSKV